MAHADNGNVAQKAKREKTTTAGSCYAVTADMRTKGHFKCKTRLDKLVIYDKDQGDFPYTINGMHVSNILGERTNGTPDNDNFRSINPNKKDERGQKMVGDDSPAVQLCKSYGGELLTEPQLEKILTSFGKGTVNWLGRLTPKLAPQELAELLAVMPDANLWTWSASLLPGNPNVALDLRGNGGIDDEVRSASKGSVRCVRM
jgi:hypothetical protein